MILEIKIEDFNGEKFKAFENLSLKSSADILRSFAIFKLSESLTSFGTIKIS